MANLRIKDQYTNLALDSFGSIQLTTDTPTEKIIDGETIAIDNSAYLATTHCWACPKQRLDGKWVYPKYDNTELTETEEDYSSDWFPSEDE